MGTRQWPLGLLSMHDGEASPARLSRTMWSAREAQGRGITEGRRPGCRQAPNSSDSKTKQAFKMPSLMKSEC